MNQKETPLISVVIPVYNVEEYLRRCVDSVVQQTYKNIEIILVDDGSPDNCGEICDQLAKKYSNVKVIHQKNAGLSAARNSGITIAKGEYVGFVDSDDFIKKEMYEVLYSAIHTFDAEMAIGGIVDCYAGKVCDSDKFDGATKVFNSKQGIKSMLLNQDNVTAHAVTKLYKRNLFQNIRFPEGKVYEDVFTCVELLLAANKVAIVNEGLYYYWHRENSIVESYFSSRDMNLLEAWEKNKEIIMKQLPELEEEMEYRYLWSCFYLLDKILVKKQKCEEKMYLIRYLRQEFRKILGNQYFLNTRKIGAIVLKLNKFCYGILTKMQMKRVQRQFGGK